MNNGKLDNQLNLALSMSEAERNETLDLGIGFSETQDIWELIVKYSNDIDRIAAEVNAAATVLLNGYAILRIPSDKIAELSTYDEIEYIEKPNRIFFEVDTAKASSCIDSVQALPYNLTGQGVTVAIIDSGIDYTHPDFRNEDGTTRISLLWDQSAVPTNSGAVYTSDDINRALAETSPDARYNIVPETDFSGHGTAVAGILCGNGRASDGRYRGVAYESDIIVVKLGNSINSSFPRTTQLMSGIDFCIREALRRNIPMVINISFGNNYGGHDGNTLLENYINEMANTGRVSIVVATGNEGASGHHAQGRFEPTENTDRVSGSRSASTEFTVRTSDNRSILVDFTVAEGERTLNLQLWKEYQDDIDITLYAPSGWSTGIIPSGSGVLRYRTGTTEIYAIYGEPKPFNISQEIYFEFIPEAGSFLQSGIWRIELTPVKILDGRYSLWLPTDEVIGNRTRFLRPSEKITLTIPSTAERVISVGAYNSDTDSAAYFSGTGFTRNGSYVKPELVAPGVSITTTTPGGYSLRTGTSFAAPFVSGAAALLMQWGIVNRNDPYLYGEKLKAYLINGARQLPGFNIWPNSQFGWGALCLRGSIPEASSV